MGYQLSVNLTDSQKLYLMENVNRKTVKELSEIMGVGREKLRQCIRLMDLRKTEGNQVKEGFFNVYEFENWIV